MTASAIYTIKACRMAYLSDAPMSHRHQVFGQGVHLERPR